MFRFIGSLFQTDSNHSSKKKTYEKNLKEAVRQKRFKDAEKIQREIDNVSNLEKMDNELEKAVKDKRYSDADTIQNNMNKFFSTITISHFSVIGVFT